VARNTRKAPYRRLMRAKEVINKTKLSIELLELLRSQLTLFYLNNKSKKEVKERVKRVECNKKKKEKYNKQLLY